VGGVTPGEGRDSKDAVSWQTDTLLDSLQLVLRCIKQLWGRWSFGRDGIVNGPLEVPRPTLARRESGEVHNLSAAVQLAKKSRAKVRCDRGRVSEGKA
jgi:hypothetical protein